jgi:hypothetical protein
LITRDNSTTADGTRGVGLCASCDRDDSDAQGVLAFFVLHETVTDETVSSAAVLIDEWAQRVARRPLKVGQAQEELGKEHHRWLDGDSSASSAGWLSEAGSAAPFPR